MPAVLAPESPVGSAPPRRGLRAGDQFRTLGGRLVTFPKLSTLPQRACRQLDAWLHAEALLETTPSGDWLRSSSYRHDLVRAMNPARLSSSDREMLNLLLFGTEDGVTAEDRL